MSILRILNRLREYREAQICRAYFDRDFYLSRNPDVAQGPLDPLRHFVRWGWREGRDPNADFSIERYRDTAPGYDASMGNPLVHAIVQGNQSRVDAASPAREGIAPASVRARQTQWPTTELPFQLPTEDELDLVTKNMDAEWYLGRYPAVAKANMSPAAHYLTVGWLMGFDPSPHFATNYYVQGNPDLRKYPGLNPYVHYLRYGRDEPARVWADVASAESLERFLDGPLAEELARAIKLDPLVALPEGRRIPNSPLVHSAAARDAIRRLRQRFAGQRFDYVITIPHVRMSGAARVAGQFAAALARVRPEARALVVLTDLTDLEHPEWFPKNCEIVKLAGYWRERVPEPARMGVLMDLIYGVEARAVININSRLFWDTLNMYGRQLSQEMAIGTYLFTWEETLLGNRVGYPVQWMRDGVGYLDAIACDAGYLASDMRERFGFVGNDADRVHTLRTPMDRACQGFHPLAAYGTRKVLWAGRFDRQKRPDVLRDIALACPDLEFDVYGRAVLDKGLEAQLNDVANINLKGEYDDFDGVLAAGYGMFLYTAQWDGMPTIVLDAIRAGLPVVAPDVGGLAEIIGPDTGWLIDTPGNVPAYTAAIEQALSNPDIAKARSRAAFDKAEAMFTAQHYDAAVSSFVAQLDEAADGHN